MMVTFVSQCEKKALNRTRRVLDAFANRIGDNTWQTIITEDGLIAVKTLLRKTATKNTAVSCHWIRSRSRSELVWIVGNRRRFNFEGVVPVNFTGKEISQYEDQNQWRTITVIRYAAGIAGLFHDFGKANQLFQEKLNPKIKTALFEPYRHEWISLRLFQAFVGMMTDDQWLEKLGQVEKDNDSKCFRDGLDGGVETNHPIKDLPPFAQLVAWLILTHHKLPICPSWKGVPSPDFQYIDEWFAGSSVNPCNFEASWNSFNCKDQDQAIRLEQNWEFNNGCLPYFSMQWRSQACLIASEARTKLSMHLTEVDNWLHQQLFTTHLSRVCLVLADHYYSAQDITPKWQNPNYKVYANTDRTTKQLKQQLDEHLIGVAEHAQKIAKALPKLQSSLLQLEPNLNTLLAQSVMAKDKLKYGWQDEAKKLAQKIGKDTLTQGFFGINMASTGKGKTLANAKIMYALGIETGRIRFSVALGLRTLTLQTGREFRNMLKLSKEELAILVGGIAVKQLFENEQSKNDNEKKPKNNAFSQLDNTGSESEEPLDADLLVDYYGNSYEHSLSQWTKKDKQLEKLLQAPVLVSTIDHLIPATEGTKGGKQIGPMLRLLSSDLVLDEPDDFGLNDLPALCRLVHCAGMLGSRVLLSTATMPPALAYALYQAYKEGWKQYSQVNVANWDTQICCAWFDEFNTQTEMINDFNVFKTLHKKFVNSRIKKLEENSQPQRKGRIIPINEMSSKIIADRLAHTIQQNILELHQHHQQSQDGKTISIGLVRMANIDPLVAVAKALLKLNVEQADTCIHYCIYHSHYPLAIRSHLENKLDRILHRKQPNNIWQENELKGGLGSILKKHKEANHVFVVLASPVAEVGRDHDYDWAIVEPSSMRSIIQLAGRVLRHRDKIPVEPNIYLLNQNYKSLKPNAKRCFDRPGFESDKLQMEEKDLEHVLNSNQYQFINAVPRIITPENYQDKKSPFSNLVDLEHKALELCLMGNHSGAKVWWRNQPHWCGEVQRQQRFRDSKQDESYYLWLVDDYATPKWKWKNEHVYPAKFADQGTIVISDSGELNKATGNNFWFDLNPLKIYTELANDFSLYLSEVSERFGEVRLIEYGNNSYQEYKYHPNMGLYKEIGNNNDL